MYEKWPALACLICALPVLGDGSGSVKQGGEWRAMRRRGPKKARTRVRKCVRSSANHSLPGFEQPRHRMAIRVASAVAVRQTID
jgi:hypothetical protein